MSSTRVSASGVLRGPGAGEEAREGPGEPTARDDAGYLLAQDAGGKPAEGAPEEYDFAVIGVRRIKPEFDAEVAKPGIPPEEREGPGSASMAESGSPKIARALPEERPRLVYRKGRPALAAQLPRCVGIGGLVEMEEEIDRGIGLVRPVGDYVVHPAL